MTPKIFQVRKAKEGNEGKKKVFFFLLLHCTADFGAAPSPVCSECVWGDAFWCLRPSGSAMHSSDSLDFLFYFIAAARLVEINKLTFDLAAK